MERLLTKNSEIAICCILKKSKEYDEVYVEKLFSMIERNTTVPHNLICVSDTFIDYPNCSVIDYGDRYKVGWRWIKMRLFEKGMFNFKRVIYFDLDTIILSNIDDLLLLRSDFAALQLWSAVRRQKGEFGTGVMVWNNTNDRYSFIADEFTEETPKQFVGNEPYISFLLPKHNKSIDALQDKMSGIYSYKRHCQQKLPKDARVICFHGIPKPRDVKNLDWMKKHWK